eukprot:5669449-Amphidinium_carterae.1
MKKKTPLGTAADGRTFVMALRHGLDSKKARPVYNTRRPSHMVVALSASSMWGRIPGILATTR